MKRKEICSDILVSLLEEPDLLEETVTGDESSSKTQKQNAKVLYGKVQGLQGWKKA